LLDRSRKLEKDIAQLKDKLAGGQGQDPRRCAPSL
jgi:hypothetical protein